MFGQALGYLNPALLNRDEALSDDARILGVLPDRYTFPQFQRGAVQPNRSAGSAKIGPGPASPSSTRVKSTSLSSSPSASRVGINFTKALRGSTPSNTATPGVETTKNEEETPSSPSTSRRHNTQQRVFTTPESEAVRDATPSGDEDTVAPGSAAAAAAAQWVNIDPEHDAGLQEAQASSSGELL